MNKEERSRIVRHLTDMLGNALNIETLMKNAPVVDGVAQVGLEEGISVDAFENSFIAHYQDKEGNDYEIKFKRKSSDSVDPLYNPDSFSKAIGGK